jgi:RimJ/RimL family protein N-acetyltransferase
MLRRAEDHDLEALRRWRNHPSVRAVSFTTHEITEAEHLRWWRGIRDDPDRRVLVYEHEGVPAGTVTYSGLLGDEPYWGFCLDLAGLDGGTLLAAWVGIERAALTHAFGPLGLKALHGEVLADNEAVRRLHRRFGFAEVRTYPRRIDGRNREVVAIRIEREDFA